MIKLIVKEIRRARAVSADPSRQGCQVNNNGFHVTRGCGVSIHPVDVGNIDQVVLFDAGYEHLGCLALDEFIDDKRAEEPGASCDDDALVFPEWVRSGRRRLRVRESWDVPSVGTRQTMFRGFTER